MLLEQRGKARRPKCFKESGMFPHAGMTQRANFLIHKTLYKTLQTPYTSRGRACHSHGSGMRQARQRRQ
jgi:hypothetical protein